MKKRGGFTLVEVIVVIVIIAILAVIATVSYIGHQQDARNAQRQTKIAILAESLEKYYDQKGEYPGCLDMIAPPNIVAGDTLKGIDQGVFLAPKAIAGAVTSIVCNDITQSTPEDVFAYVGDGSQNCSTGQACLEWALKYKEERTNDIKSVQSRRKTNVATSGEITLAAPSVTGFTTMDLSWTQVPNAVSYEVQRATNSTFTAGVQSRNYTTLSTSLSDLAYGTQYFFRVRAIATNSQGAWSNVRAATTWSLAKPTVTLSAAATTFTANWNAITNAASYVAQCSSDGVTWSASACQIVTANRTATFPNAAQGFTYYVRVQATNGGFSGEWSDVRSATTSINGPSAYTISASNVGGSSWNWLTGTSNAVCPAGTTPSYDWYRNGSTFWVSGTQYRAVSYALSWNETVTLSVATRCIRGSVSSGFVWASNTISMSLPWPSVSVWLPGDSVMYWGGSCPNHTSSHYYNFRTNGRVNASGNTTATSYAPGTWWGNGRAYVTLYCSGPWGTAAAEANSMYGPGCVPTPTVAECWQ